MQTSLAHPFKKENVVLNFQDVEPGQYEYDMSGI
jgi:hypothetical protein